MRADTFNKLWHDVLVGLDVAERRARQRLMPREWAEVELWQVVSREQFGAIVLTGPGVDPLYLPYKAHKARTTKIRVLWYYDEYTVATYRDETRYRHPTVIRPEPWKVTKTDQERVLAGKIVDHLDQLIRETLKDKDLCLPESRLVYYHKAVSWDVWDVQYVRVTDERSTEWFCLEHLCVPRSSDLSMSLYAAGFNNEQVSKILRNEASKGEIEAWVACISIQSGEV